MRTCKFCFTERPLNEFRTRLTQKTRKRIYYHECKPCYNERIRNSEESRKYAAARQRQARKDNPEQYRSYELKKRHKITLETYNEKLKEQGGLCAICGMTGNFGRNLAVDHDHSCCNHDKSCGKCLRGLLCTGCNSGLGSFRDNIDNLKKAIIYLETVKPGEWTYQ